MTKHLFGIVLTPFGTAANNRGETEGNVTTLQKIVWKGAVHTTVSAEAIRWAIRARWQEWNKPVNRKWDEERRIHNWDDPDFTKGAADYVDDDVLGFMSARAAKQEAGEPEEAGGQGARVGRPRPRGSADVRRARLEVTRAISLHPWPGDYVFNAASPGATPSASKSGQDPVPYGAEVHATRYQYGFALTPSALHDRSRAGLVLDAIRSLSEVGGNHARFLYDFSPASVVLRWTDDAAPRLLYGFEPTADDEVGIPRLVELVEAGDLNAQELWIGGEVATSSDAARLIGAGAVVTRGVGDAFARVQKRMKEDLA